MIHVFELFNITKLMGQFLNHVIFKLFVSDFIDDNISQLSIFSFSFDLLNFGKFSFDFYLRVNFRLLDTRSCPWTPTLNTLLLWLNILFIILESILLEFTQILQYSLVSNTILLRVVVIENIPIHLDQLLIDFQLHSLRLILILKFLDIQPFS